LTDSTPFHSGETKTEKGDVHSEGREKGFRGPQKGTYQRVCHLLHRRTLTHLLAFAQDSPVKKVPNVKKASLKKTINKTMHKTMKLPDGVVSKTVLLKTVVVRVGTALRGTRFINGVNI